MTRLDIVKKISDGVFAEMLLARLEGSADRVVVEVLRPELTGDTAWVNRFVEEAKHRKALVHPSLPRRVRGGRTPDGRLYVASEPLNGEDLGSVLQRRGTLRVDEVVALMIPLCEAVEYLHERGLTHGYLKPSNIYLVGGLEQYRPKLLDFGLAFFRGGKAAPTGRVLVENEYLSPERLSGIRGDIRSDVYALGLLMYQLVSGHPPFHSSDPLQTRRLQLEAPPPPLEEGAAKLGPVLERCLAKNPADRFDSVQQLRESLTHLVRRDAESTQALPDTAPGESAAEKLNDVLGNYRLEKLLGEGAMGRVYQARHVRLGRQVAVKVMRPELALSRTFVQRFFQEARSANQINHEHIVEIVDFCEEVVPGVGHRVFCVMELLSGENLGERLRKTSPSISQVASIARQICSALDAAHRVGVVHRDVKPDNIFLTEKSGATDYVKVLDFGVAKLLSAPSEAPAANTLEGVVVGTPAYMAPEQAEGMSDHRTDIYALGVVLYKALAGRAPFEGRSFAELMVRIFRDPPPPLPRLTPGKEVIPGALRELVRKCLEKDPQKRPQSMATVSEALFPFSREGVHRPLAAPRWRIRTLVSLGLLALVGGGYLAYEHWRRPREEPTPPTITLRVRSAPPGALVRRLDTDKTLGRTPLKLELPKTEQPLPLRVELEGYEPLDRSMLLTTDSTIEAALRPLPPTRKSKRSRPAAEGSR